jgi:hypothetical protein
MGTEGLSVDVDGLKVWDEGVDEREAVAEPSVDSGVEYVPAGSFTRPFNLNTEILVGQSSGSAIL